MNFGRIPVTRSYRQRITFLELWGIQRYCGGMQAVSESVTKKENVLYDDLVNKLIEQQLNPPLSGRSTEERGQPQPPRVRGEERAVRGHHGGGLREGGRQGGQVCGCAGLCSRPSLHLSHRPQGGPQHGVSGGNLSEVSQGSVAGKLNNIHLIRLGNSLD